MLNPKLSLTGVPEMKGKFARIKSGFGREVVAALYQETQIETTEVKRRTPVDTGELRASVHVVGPFSQGDRIWTLIACGGLAAKYAVYVHENLEAFHKVGQAKFLESVILESRPFMAKRVADRISLNRALAGGQ